MTFTYKLLAEFNMYKGIEWKHVCLRIAKHPLSLCVYLDMWICQQNVNRISIMTVDKKLKLQTQQAVFFFFFWYKRICDTVELDKRSQMLMRTQRQHLSIAKGDSQPCYF